MASLVEMWRCLLAASFHVAPLSLSDLLPQKGFAAGRANTFNMVRGLYTSAAGMLTQWNRQSVLANNLANADTVGFKKDEALVRAYPQMVVHRTNDAWLKMSRFTLELRPPIGLLGTGSEVEEVEPVMTQGKVRKTGNPLDMAIEGEGFFVIQTPQGERFTRDGGFSLDRQGFLVNKNGARVLGVDGPIQLGPGRLVVDEAGRLFIDGEQAGQLLIAGFIEPQGLEKEGDNLFRQTGRSGLPVQTEDFVLHQGMLEYPNLEVVLEMVEMINAFRAYEANARAVSSQESTLDRLINAVGATP